MSLKGYCLQPSIMIKQEEKNAWKALSIISLAIGQGELGTTPLQLANLAVIIANRGYYYTPHIVKAIGNEKNKNLRFNTPNETGIESQYFDPIIQGMKDAVVKRNGDPRRSRSNFLLQAKQELHRTLMGNRIRYLFVLLPLRIRK